MARASGDSDRTEADAALRRAASVAAGQGAVSFELRARISLARLHAGTNVADQTIEELRETYGRLDEGFTTTDLADAAASIGDTPATL